MRITSFAARGAEVSSGGHKWLRCRRPGEPGRVFLAACGRKFGLLSATCIRFSEMCAPTPGCVCSSGPAYCRPAPASHKGRSARQIWHPAFESGLSPGSLTHPPSLSHTYTHPPSLSLFPSVSLTSAQAGSPTHPTLSSVRGGSYRHCPSTRTRPSVRPQRRPGRSAGR